MVAPDGCAPRSRRRLLLLLCWCGALPAARGQVGAFRYEPITEPIASASYSVNLAALTAHRFVAGSELNFVKLLDLSTGLPPLDLSGSLFGTAAFPQAPELDQGSLATGVFTVPIDPAFFPALVSGNVGLDALLTDTGDALFAIDTMYLTIQETGGALIESFYGSAHDGFGIGIPDYGDLPAPLPESLPPGSTGTGFDESITSKRIFVPEPSGVVLLALAACLAGRGRRAGR